MGIMSKITLNFAAKKGAKVLAAFKAHRLSPLVDPETGEPYTETELLKKGLIALIAREVYAYEQARAVQAARVVMDEAEESVVPDPDIAS